MIDDNYRAKTTCKDCRQQKSKTEFRYVYFDFDNKKVVSTDSKRVVVINIFDNDIKKCSGKHFVSKSTLLGWLKDVKTKKTNKVFFRKNALIKADNDMNVLRLHNDTRFKYFNYDVSFKTLDTMVFATDKIENLQKRLSQRKIFVEKKEIKPFIKAFKKETGIKIYYTFNKKNTVTVEIAPNIYTEALFIAEL